jgi:myo-inositol 2-dehydrogenase/D-chiro-inositol 1-dehydrogenase
MPPRKLNVACSGLGRMGSLHALHFLHRTPRAELVAAFSPCQKEIAWARQHLEPHGVTLYMDYAEMLKHPGLEAVVIAVVTTKHAEQAIKAIEADKHVLCEKPLSTSVEVVRVGTAPQIPTVIANSGDSLNPLWMLQLSNHI